MPVDPLVSSSIAKTDVMFQRFYIVGSNQSDERFRVLKIDRTSGNELNVIDDEVVYSKQEITELLGMIENGNKSSGGLHKVVSFFGIVGGCCPSFHMGIRTVWYNGE